YAPQALRSEIRIILNRLEEKHPGMKYTIFRSIERIRPALEGVAERELKECRICGEPTTGEICKVCELLRELGI
ncbi:MAG TPA: TIGR00269 family protein, partial [Candidatus Bathyarchaeota archaeon]|nr:TIGR00269 family protein [Candidatus Bathyarchaeota archaeon]HEX68693.1 TIGR00269 family protein [Candidatus Bathyarchaeota archaeon]